MSHSFDSGLDTFTHSSCSIKKLPDCEDASLLVLFTAQSGDRWITNCNNSQTLRHGGFHVGKRSAVIDRRCCR